MKHNGALIASTNLFGSIPHHPNPLSMVNYGLGALVVAPARGYRLSIYLNCDLIGLALYSSASGFTKTTELIMDPG